MAKKRATPAYLSQLVDNKSTLLRPRKVNLEIFEKPESIEEQRIEQSDITTDIIDDIEISQSDIYQSVISHDDTIHKENDINQPLHSVSDTKPSASEINVSMDEIVQSIFDLSDSSKSLILRFSESEMKMLDQFIEKFKPRELKNNSIAVNKIIRYCITYVLLNEPKSLEKAIKNKLTKKVSSIFD